MSARKYYIEPNQIFGYWTVIELDKSNPRKSYICKCKCGTVRSIRVDFLVDKKTTSCGCKLIKYPINIGNKFNDWTVLEKIYGSNDREYKCKCKCGTLRLVKGPSLATGESKSCGCFRNNYRRKNNLSPAFNYLVSSYQKSARKRGLKWELSEEDCLKLFKSDCFYCGIEPNIQASYKRNKPQLEIWQFLYNGIDRKDNSLGYIPENIVACCKICNYAKRDFSMESFENWIKRLINFQKDKQG